MLQLSDFMCFILITGTLNWIIAAGGGVLYTSDTPFKSKNYAVKCIKSYAERRKMDRISEIIEIIEELVNKGYSYVNISIFLANKGILGKSDKPFTKAGIEYYVKKYNINLEMKSYIDLQCLYFNKDRYYFLLNVSSMKSIDYYPNKQVFVDI